MFQRSTQNIYKLKSTLIKIRSQSIIKSRRLFAEMPNRTPSPLNIEPVINPERSHFQKFTAAFIGRCIAEGLFFGYVYLVIWETFLLQFSYIHGIHYMLTNTRSVINVLVSMFCCFG
eukprot:UN01186